MTHSILGLTKDDPGVYEERLKFWKDFNHCWLAFLTRQLQNSRALQGSGQPLTGVQTVLSKDNVKALGDELIGLNDDLKLTGLIDYEMGVWEEEIVNGKQIYITWISNISLTYHRTCSMLGRLGGCGVLSAGDTHNGTVIVPRRA